jgi:O-antigen ligase
VHYERLRRRSKISPRALSTRFSRSRFVQLPAKQLRAIGLNDLGWLTAITLAASLLLGGGTRSGFLSDVALQLISIPLVLMSVSRLDHLRGDGGELRAVRWELAFCIALLLVPLLQLVPLPPQLWTLLPHRAAEIAAFAEAEQPLPWMPVSVSPNDTWRSVPALLPPLGVFLGTLLADFRERRVLSLVIVVLGVVSAFLGLLQIARGPASSLRFFTVTNLTEAVGFFANRNHLAALLYVVLLLTTVWLIQIGSKASFRTNRKPLETRSMLVVTGSALGIVILLAGEAMARSRAGLILTMASLVCVFVLVVTDRRRKASATPTNLLFAAVGTSLILAVQFALYRILDRLAADPLDDVRVQFARNTLAAALAYLPFGSGTGTFVPVYQMFERPADLAAHVYVNHAHNDVVEVCLEGGVIGMALMVAFAAWFVSRSVAIWRHELPGGAAFDQLLARAATFIVGLLIAHSFFDYPLRTAAMMAVFAFACALLIEPLTSLDWRGRRNGASAHAEALRQTQPHSEIPLDHVSRPSPPAAAAASSAPRNTEVAARKQSLRSGERWGEDVEWPAPWRGSGRDGNAAGTKSEDNDK